MATTPSCYFIARHCRATLASDESTPRSYLEYGRDLSVGSKDFTLWEMGKTKVFTTGDYEQQRGGCAIVSRPFPQRAYARNGLSCVSWAIVASATPAWRNLGKKVSQR